MTLSRFHHRFNARLCLGFSAFALLIPGTAEAQVGRDMGCSPTLRSPCSGTGGSSGGSSGASQLGGAIGRALGGAIIEGLFGNPQEDAERTQEAAAAAQRESEAAQRRDAESRRQSELARQRILGQLKDTSGTGGLRLKVTESESTLAVSSRQVGFGSAAIMPVQSSGGAGPVLQGLQLKLGDEAEIASRRSGQGFDSAGKMLGGGLGPAPAAPSLAAADKLWAAQSAAKERLKEWLKANDAEEVKLKGLLAQLQGATAQDASSIVALQGIIASKEVEKKKLMLDLSAVDPDDVAEAPQ